MIRLLLLASLFPALAFGQPFRWTTYTSTSNVLDLATANGSIWSATNGGLSGYDPATGLFDVHTNTRGLAMNRSSAVGRDSRGWIWAAHISGAITRVNPSTGQTLVIDDLRDEVFEITTILDVGDEVFVAANNGIFRFSYSTVGDNYRILESIRVLGVFPGEARVSDLAVAGGYLYAATVFGLARANLSNEFLSAPSAWENFSTTNGLPENSLAALYGASDTTVWIAGSGQVVRFDGTAFATISATAGVLAFAEWNGAVHAATPGTVYRIDGTTLTPVGQGLPGIRDLITANDANGSTLVAGIGDNFSARGGLSFLVTDQWTDPVSAHNIGSNFITALGADPQGKLWAGGGGDGTGVFAYDGQSWTNYHPGAQHPQPFFYRAPNSFAFDNHGGAWAGSEGGGVAWFHGNDITLFNPTDQSGWDADTARLTWTDGNVDYCVAAVARNMNGDIFITNRASTTNKPLVRVQESWIVRGNNSDSWLYYTAQPNNPQALEHRDVVQMVPDQYNRMWVGSHERNGTENWVFDDNGTPADTTDDQWFGYVPPDLQDQITCFEPLLKGVVSWDIDQQGYLWIGTHSGAYYTQAGVPRDLNQLRFICVVDLPVGDNVNAIHVDAQDNKWFGTDNGVAVLDKNFSWIHVFKTADAPENRSDLASNTVTSITSDPRTGDVWIGTTDGLSRLQTPYLSRGETLGEVWPYPNPFVADGSHRMFVDHQRIGGSFDDFRIFTLSGRLVRELSWQQMIDPQTGWDGRTADGDLVAGGVYLLVASAANGNSATGKIAVLGK